jgi:2-polyprenyl-6-methoxyphenol hydroxylase-like FAD-dependent oxidoreductase
VIGLKRAAIVGCGSGGMTTAVDLGLKGFNLNIFDFPEFDRNLRATSRESPPTTMVAPPTTLLLYTRAVLNMPTATPVTDTVRAHEDQEPSKD